MMKWRGDEEEEEEEEERKNRRTLELFGRRKGENPSGAKPSRLSSSLPQ